jgi:hypothetical protein
LEDFFMRRTVSAALCIAVFSLAGCKAKEAFDHARIAADLHSRSTTALLKQTADDHYTAPADGRLTEAQVQMYLKVRDHEKEIAQAARKELQQHSAAAKQAGDKSLAGVVEGFKGLGSVADLLTADVRAAQDLRYNTQEYLWVKGQVLAASSAAMGEKMGQAMNASLDASYQQMKKAHDEATDEATKKMYADMLAGYDKTRQEMAQEKAQQDPALSFNKDLLSRHENALNALTSEMSKYEEKPGETKQSMEKWQKDVDQGIQQAKQQAQAPAKP